MEQSPVALFFLVPAYALLLKLLYVRKKLYYVEHLVFAMHLHAFSFLALTALLLAPETTWLGTTLLVVMTVYYYAALLRYYAQGWFKTLVKMGLLTVGYTFLIVPAVLLMGLVAFALA